MKANTDTQRTCYKITTTDKEMGEKVKPFPKLMISISDGCLYLVDSKGGAWGFTEGYYFEELFDEPLIDYNEPLTIQNI